MAEETVRTSRKFSWDEVDPRLVRKLLATAYSADGQFEDARHARRLSDAETRQQARATFGRPPKKRFRDDPGLLDVLRDAWLPAASPDLISDLVYQLDRYSHITSKKAGLQRIRDSNRTSRLKHLVWRSFIDAHKAEMSVKQRTRSTTEAVRHEGIFLRGFEQKRRTPYPHQSEAWGALDTLRRSHRERRVGSIEIPTGGGKTATAVTWLIDELAKRPKLRVLWIADQHELVEQAARAFEHTARTQSGAFAKKLRIVHGAAAGSSMLNDPALDVVCATRQSLLGKTFDRTAKAHLSSFLSRPVVVVIDEAHHAVSPTYQRLIDFMWSVAADMILIGLTATPWPAGQLRTFQETFGSMPLVKRTTTELIATGDLARPVVHTVPTNARVDLSDEAKRLLGNTRELPPEVARQLDQAGRNTLAVESWLKHSAMWGKTLVFACDTRHADALGREFESRGVRTDVVHSAADTNLAVVLDSFRAATDERVLVSVGMLLEGVDIPNARTAFLCRPTASRIVMRQMIGRVLRGVRAGGDPEAHIVDFVDQWGEFVGILRPVDLPDVAVSPTSAGEGTAEHKLPPIMSSDGASEIGSDLLHAIERSMNEAVKRGGLSATLSGSRLIGFYDLDHRRIPVFEHCLETWRDVSTWALGPRSGRARSAVSLFDDVPPPSPLDEEIDGFIEQCRSIGTAPPLVHLDASLDVRAAARRLINAGATSEHDRVEMLRREYETTLARPFFPSLQMFIEAVDQEKLDLLDVIPSGANPESVRTVNLPSPARRRVNHNPHREGVLEGLLSEVVTEGRRLLAGESEYDGWLDDEWLPCIRWSRRPLKKMWAFHQVQLPSCGNKLPFIAVNSALQVSTKYVPDELLRYLIWHELCHHLMPRQGHNAEFRRLEALWTDHAQLDYELDTLGERFELPGMRDSS
ncbi:DEAD/DEAH box helicase [Rudaeicoccus suwonensis]|uniref:Superfamily II DNA or RNA helicase n=1 Tax=Rudaeicoccus suwonensis TaxID=657409 RepID=A0A561EC45_9MICO|nr:DEAD/DEAH box helicase family protein [Rudaeicoccus suwonensis]TWE13180.1 superfamily II DNA or RNA helicase [Rudaeicoccus suwonensis]